MAVVAIVFVGLVALAIMLFSKKPDASAKPKKARADQSEVKRPARSSRPAAAATGTRLDRRAQRREERKKRMRDEKSASGTSRRTGRSSSGGFSRSGGSRSSQDPNQLRAIVTDGTGVRFALVGEKRLKTGDGLEGRTILEVGPDNVKVQFRNNTYTVRVGDKVY
jgi:sRNA-binding protein